MSEKRFHIVYLTPALYMAGGVERVLTLKANYFADHYGYDITIILTEGKDKPLFYPLSDKVKVMNLDIGFEELWHCSFLKKVWIYLRKQRKYRKLLTAELLRLRPDITVSLLRREINFLHTIPDGSKKIGEMHINRANYRNFEGGSLLQRLFARFWMGNLVGHLRTLDGFVVLTEEDRLAWTELDRVVAIPNPLPFLPSEKSPLTAKRVIAVGRYCHEKGFDLLLQAWAIVQEKCPDWQLAVYGEGDRSPYELLVDKLRLDRTRCVLNGRTSDIEAEYLRSSLSVCSSRFEGFGLSLVESMACGLPVVSFHCPWGPQSIVSDGEDGLLVENGNVERLADSLIRLMLHPDELVRMADRAVVNVRRFAMDQVALRWKSLFEEVCSV